ncbi:MAG: hypothetical protein HY730_02625 [Candidatus Tectomicrobia bacterium]|uniref:Uncharacterized protein n=1 Tax=Tectimicrobiota bacterium TaxID=2528274 RepID=A0A933GKX6_UNCTE|nr:hypothetical protein [Candidatus Tectomicrobia bacterium]
MTKAIILRIFLVVILVLSFSCTGGGKSIWNCKVIGSIEYALFYILFGILLCGLLVASRLVVREVRVSA